METYYIANRKLLIPNGPGAVPSSVRVEKGEIFSLDGTEPIDLDALLEGGAISPSEKPTRIAEIPTPQAAIPTRKPAIRRKN